MGDGNGGYSSYTFCFPLPLSTEPELETPVLYCLDWFISGTLSGIVYDDSDLMQRSADPKESASGSNWHTRDGIAIHGEVADENPEKQSSMDGEFDRKGQN